MLRQCPSILLTTRRAFPSGRAVWRQLTQPVQLQEACFKDAVLLYRPAGAAAAAAQAAAAGHHHVRASAAGGPAAGGGGGSGGKAATGTGAQHQAPEGLQSVEESVGGTSDEVDGLWGCGACSTCSATRWQPRRWHFIAQPGRWGDMHWVERLLLSQSLPLYNLALLPRRPAWC